ncbi:MAG TPA: type II secretion system protein [Candidatus Dormibacteraeota bacterium]|nr:type II secretion system protein [Candidatus Dormibacteraeota bacterium]
MTLAGQQAANRGTHRKGGCGGFTLLELMIVITIIVILATVGAMRYEQSLKTARVAAQQQDLFVLRKAIQQYTEDKNQPPSSLDDLQSAGYIGSVPTDPVTHQRDWTTEPCDELFSADQTSSEGICDVQVGTDQNSSSGDQSSDSSD